MSNKRKLNHYNVVRESELDMRCLVRDMTERRGNYAEILRLRAAKFKGKVIDEAALARMVAKNRRLSKAVLVGWERLHNRMNRARAEKERIESVFTERSADGNAANP